MGPFKLLVAGKPCSAHVHALLTPCSADIFFVAHPDDDLLFQSPSLLHSLSSGDHHCTTTVYFTAGDAGLHWASGYPLQRETGVRAAYETMLATNGSESGQASSRNTRQIFYTIPDGNSDGSGYAVHNHTSLKQLYEGKIPEIASVFTIGGFPPRHWTLKSLERAVLSHLRSFSTMAMANLTVHLQDWEKPNELIGPDGEHSDHVVGAKIVRDVLMANAEEFRDAVVVRSVRPPHISQISLYFIRLTEPIAGHFGLIRLEWLLTVGFERHLGYETQWQPANVDAADLAAKARAFYTYAAYDDELSVSCRAKIRDGLLTRYTDSVAKNSIARTLMTYTGFGFSADTCIHAL